jgi:hypothetical protein
MQSEKKILREAFPHLISLHIPITSLKGKFSFSNNTEFIIYVVCKMDIKLLWICTPHFGQNTGGSDTEETPSVNVITVLA